MKAEVHIYIGILMHYLSNPYKYSNNIGLHKLNYNFNTNCRHWSPFKIPTVIKIVLFLNYYRFNVYFWIFRTLRLSLKIIIPILNEFLLCIFQNIFFLTCLLSIYVFCKLYVCMAVFKKNVRTYLRLFYVLPESNSI